jgi:hypothetical protein
LKRYIDRQDRIFLKLYGVECDERYVWDSMIDRAFSPHRCPLAPETQADGLGWYGVAPSVLGFAATRAAASAPQARRYPSSGTKGICGDCKIQILFVP